MIDIKIKILIGVLVIIIGVCGWWIWDTQTQKEVDCSKITSMLNIEKCIGERIEAIGILDCEKPDVPPKAGIYYLKFEDGSELRFLKEYAGCEDYDGKKVEVIGEFNQCGEFAQCAGSGLINIQSVNLISEPIGKVTIITDKTEYEQGEEIEIEVSSTEQIYYLPLLSFALTLEQKDNGIWTEIPFNEVAVINCLGIMPEAPSCSIAEARDTWWDHSIFSECINREPKFKQASPGTYRFLFQYWEDDCWGSIEKEIYSNEFIINDKKRQEEGYNPIMRCGGGACKCMKEKECEPYGGAYIIPTGEGECSVNSDNKMCCCPGV